jgi:hypothetical protein
VKGDLGVITSGDRHLVFVPGITTHIEDPRFRNELLLLSWEGASPSSTGPLPHGPSVHFSKKCADSPIGQAFTHALVRAAVLSHTQAGRVSPATEDSTRSTQGE